MKKLVLAASLVIAFAASAQKRDNGMRNVKVERYMAAFFRQVKIGVLTLTLEKKQ